MKAAEEDPKMALKQLELQKTVSAKHDAQLQVHYRHISAFSLEIGQQCVLCPCLYFLHSCSTETQTCSAKQEQRALAAKHEKQLRDLLDKQAGARDWMLLTLSVSLFWLIFGLMVSLLQRRARRCRRGTMRPWQCSPSRHKWVLLATPWRYNSPALKLGTNVAL